MDANGNPFKFMLWAGDKDPDTFRIRIWTEDEAGVETDVYDNGSSRRSAPATLWCTPSRRVSPSRK